MSKVYRFDWHNDQCKRTKEYTDRNGNKVFFCETHHQWTAELPVKKVIEYTYGDGTVERSEFVV